MTVGDVANDIAQVFGMPSFAAAPDFTQARILVDINSAIQQMQQAGEDYYGREDLGVTLVQGQNVYVLPQTVQSVIDPVMLSDGTLLTKLTNHGQLNRFGELFLDQLTPTVDNGKPTHFFVHPGRQTSGADDVLIDFYVMPPPDASNSGAGKLQLHVINEPTILTAAQLTAGTAILPVPDKYVESIFLPLARWNSTTSFLFYEKDKIPRYEQEYTRAVRLLGYTDPRQPKPVDSSTRALELDQPSAQASISPVQKGPQR